MKKNKSNAATDSAVVGEVEYACGYCRFASEVTGTEDMLCRKRGVVSKQFICKKFVYDPLKRSPRRAPALIIPELPFDNEEP
mgnify:FL=1